MPQTLYRSFLESTEGGAALPQPFGPLQQAGIQFREGQVSITGAGPGGGKSAFWLNYIMAKEVAESVPTLYLSFDSDIMTIGPRMVAAVRNTPLSRILWEFDQRGNDYRANLDIAKQFRHVQWCFRPSPTVDDIKDELTAYEAVHGYFPRLIVLDNIRDVLLDVGDGIDHQRHGATVDYFHEMAKVTGAHCALLHHLTGPYEDGTEPPPLSALLGKIGKQARLVLNLYTPVEGSDELGVVVAKASNARRTRLDEPITLNWDRETQIIT